MKKYDVKTVGGVDFFYIGNDVNGNCQYAVNYRFFLNKEEMAEDFDKRLGIARERAKEVGFERILNRSIEPFFVIRSLRLAEVAAQIKFIAR